MANSLINSSTRPAIGGSGVTVMKFGGDVVAFCNSVTVTYPIAVAEAIDVQPLDAIRPLEIVTARAIKSGTITLSLTSLYNQHIWDRLGGETLQGLDDLADILKRVQDVYGNTLTVERYITPAIKDGKTYVEQFLGCVITGVKDEQAIETGTMLLNREIDITYRRHVRSGKGWNATMPGGKPSSDVVQVK